MSLFSTGDIIQKSGNQTSDRFVKKSKQFLKEMFVFSSANKTQCSIMSDLFDNFRLPDPGEVLRIRTQRQLNLIGLVSKIIAVHGKIETLHVCTYTLNIDNFNDLVRLVKKGIIENLFLMIASSYEFRNKSHYDQFSQTCAAAPGIVLVFAWSHFKISMAKAGGEFYHWEGSMNYSTNNMAENLILSNCETTYNHDKNFIENIMTSRDRKDLKIICHPKTKNQFQIQ